MKITIGNEVTVERPTPAVKDICKSLVIDNPDYISRERMGKWTGNTPKKLYLYSQRGNDLILPYGTKSKLKTIGCECVWEKYPEISNFKADYNSNISLYDYQEDAVQRMIHAVNGIVVMPCGSGKGLPLNAKVYTPDGFKLNGSLCVGDGVIGSDGKTYQVTGIYDKGEVPAYKITFSDNTEIVCDKDHLWTVQKQTQRFDNPDKWWTVSTEEIYKQYKNIKRQDLLYIPVVKPVEFKAKEVHLNPWLLGFLIGDGCFRDDISVSIAESDLLQKVADIIHNEYPTEIMKVKSKWDWRFAGRNIKRAIDSVGLGYKHSYEKFIPDEYKYNSIDVRLGILQGLFDADGYYRQSGVYEYSTSSKKLADDFIEVVQSLGGIAKVRARKPKYTYNGEKKAGRTSYRITFKLYDFEPFTSNKHSAKRYDRVKYVKPYRIIKDIQKCEPIVSRCITVNSPDSLYVTDAFVVTHNTQTALECVARLGLKTLWLTHTQDLLNQSMERAKMCFDCDNDMFGTITAGKINISNGITFATVQTMCKIDLSKYSREWAVIVVDECMPWNTLIDTPNGKKCLGELQVGDVVVSYNKNTGKLENKRVLHTFKNKAHDVVSVNLANGKRIVCTGNHPVYTQNGEWVEAERLTKDDYALQLVWEKSRHGRYAEDYTPQNNEKRILLLLKGMFNKRWKNEVCVDRGTQSKSIKNNERHKQSLSRTVCGAHENGQSYEKFGCKESCIRQTEKDRSQAGCSWGKWHWNDNTAKIIGRRAVKKPNRFDRLCGISNTNKSKEKQWLSYLLQGRYCFDRAYDSNRSGWEFSLCFDKTRTRQKERCFFEWVRVDSVEVQKQTSDGTFGGLCADGYVYNIEVEDNNNYFADNVLVHNCQHCCGSPTRMTQFYQVVNSLYAPYKFGLTATPDRTDGLDVSMYALLGDKIIEVNKECVSSRTCPVEVRFFETNYNPDADEILNGDGTIDYAKLASNLVCDAERFSYVADLIDHECQGYAMVLANRVQYLQDLKEVFLGNGIVLSAMGTSKKARQERKEALQKLNNGEIDCIFATYQLAAEGLDCPNLRTIVFATPEKNARTVTQAVGRVARKADGKECGRVFDFIDNFGLYKGWVDIRHRLYKKIGCVLCKT